MASDARHPLQPRNLREGEKQMADNYQTGGVHPPKDHGVDGQVTPLAMDEAAVGTNKGSPLDDRDGFGIKNAK